MFLATCMAGGVASAMELTVILPGGQTLTVSSEPNHTVRQVKQRIYAISEINPLNQILYYKDKRLEENHTLSSYHIGEGDTIRVKHGVLNAPTSKEKSIFWRIALILLAILGIGIFFMRKKPSREYDGA